MKPKRGNPALRRELARQLRIYRDYRLITSRAALLASIALCRNVVAFHLTRDTNVSSRRRRSHDRL